MNSMDVDGEVERPDEPKKPIETDEDEDEVTMYMMPYFRSNEEDVYAAWPKVESALQQYGITCELDRAIRFMKFFVPRGSDPAAVSKADQLLSLISFTVPAAQALRVMEGAPCDIIYTGLASHALAGLYGIKLDEYRRRKKLLTTLPGEELAAFVGCDIYLRPKYDFVAAIGPVAGLRLVRKIVHECIVHNVPPAPRLKHFKTYLQAKRGLTKLRLA